MGRIWFALVALAIFSMHGAPSTAATRTDAHHGMVADAGVTVAGLSMLTAASAAAADALPSVEVIVGDSGSAAGPPSPGSADHGSAGHIWAACLAVLAGLVLAATVILGRGTGVVTPPGPISGRQRPRWRFRTPRPPDLFALCLLRT